jgi:ketosteroid isomerase-like protein
MSTGIGLVERMLNAFATRDWAALADSYHDDIVFELMYPPVFDDVLADTLSAPVIGRPALVAMMSGAVDPTTGVFASLRIFNIRPRAMVPDDEVVAEYESDAIVRQTGRPYRNVYIALFKIRDNRIVSWREYANPDRVRQALVPR